MKTNINFLKIPLNKLHFIDDMNDFNGLEQDELESLKREYDEQELKGIIDSIKWAAQNPNYNFLSLLPDLPFSNTEIYGYFCKVEKSLVQL